jgi:hypothetical protein
VSVRFSLRLAFTRREEKKRSSRLELSVFLIFFALFHREHRPVRLSFLSTCCSNINALEKRRDEDEEEKKPIKLRKEKRQKKKKKTKKEKKQGRNL